MPTMETETKNGFEYPFRMAAVATTIALFVVENNRPTGEVVVGIRSDNSDAYPGMPCLPGGFLDVGTEQLEDCIIREVKEELDLTLDPITNKLSLAFVDSEFGADPRYSQVINPVYCATVTHDQLSFAKACDDLKDFQAIHIDLINNGHYEMAFNHSTLVMKAYNALSYNT